MLGPVAILASFFGQSFQSFEDLLLLAITQLMEQRLDPLLSLSRVRMEIASDIPQVLGSVVKVQFLDSPHRAAWA